MSWIDDVDCSGTNGINRTCLWLNRIFGICKMIVSNTKPRLKSLEIRPVKIKTQDTIFVRLQVVLYFQKQLIVS